MPCYTHQTVLRSSSGELKALECWNPIDPIGFEEECEASRISLVRSGVFGWGPRGESLLADSTQVLFVNRGDVRRFVHPVEGGDSCTIMEAAPAALHEIQWRFERRARRFPVDQICATNHIARLHFALLRLVTRGAQQAVLAEEELFIDLLNETLSAAYRHSRPSCSASCAGVVARQRAIVENTRLVLNTHLQTPPSLSDLAGQMNCSAFHLSRIFRAHSGMTMRTYLGQLRANAAVRRLIDGADDLSALALELGFYDHSHFTNAFVAAWGVPPSQFRSGRRAIVSKPLRGGLA
jgi:AraC family transcriptional regulator